MTVATPRRKNLEGITSGKLTVSGESKKVGKRVFWLCFCECGESKYVPAANLTIGKTKSCGCSTNKFIGDKNRKHGMSGTRTHNIWLSMISRCRDKCSPSYKYYGGKGVSVCLEWKSFENFLNDMGDVPSDTHQIDRIDSNKGYYIGNCRWATPKENSNNRSTTKYLTYDGVTMPRSEWADKLGFPRFLIYNRLKAGWSIEKTLSTPHDKYNKITNIGFNNHFGGMRDDSTRDDANKTDTDNRAK